MNIAAGQKDCQLTMVPDSGVPILEEGFIDRFALLLRGEKPRIESLRGGYNVRQTC